MSVTHNPILSVFGTVTGSIADGGPYYQCMECDRAVIVIKNERRRDVPAHIVRKWREVAP